MAETDALEWIHHKESAIDRKFGEHDAFVIPVAYDIALGEFHHLQGIPTLGNVFYSEARRVIELQLKASSD